MKIELTLNTRPGILHALPMIDILALVMIIPMLSSAFTDIGGINVTLPASDIYEIRKESPIVVTVVGGEDPQVWVNRVKVTRQTYLQEVAKQAENWKHGGAVAIAFKCDVNVPYQVRRKMSEELLIAGYHVRDVGETR